MSPIILKLIFSDKWTYIGSLGVILMTATEWINQHISPWMAVIGAMLGAILAILTIYEKWATIRVNTRLKDHELRLKEMEIKEMEREIRRKDREERKRRE